MRLLQVKRFPGRGRPGHQQSPTRHRGCSLGILAGVGALLLVAASCAPSGEAPRAALPTEIEDTGDLLAVLRGAGVSVQPTSTLPTLGFGGRGQVVQIGEALAEVHEFGSVEDREKVSASIVAGAQAAGPLASAQSSTPSFWAAGRLIVAYTGSDGGTVLLLQALLGDPITLAAEVVDEPYPPAVLA
ncbi:MAG: hypothetical protein MUO23_10365, partial [Anaerolineales bacterium]|nr:hypothetical protein [Anaerolineales bacterium]